MEEWRDVVGYEGVYMVSNLGRVKSLDHLVLHSNGWNRIQKGRILKTNESKKGYIQVCLSREGSRYHTGVHRLVAKSFIENPLNKPHVNHKNCNKKDNSPENLEWCTNKENIIHAYSNGLVRLNRGEKHHKSKLTDEQMQDVINRRSNGESFRTISEDYSISITALSNRMRNINKQSNNKSNV